MVQMSTLNNIQTFSSYKFLFDKLAQPLTITVKGEQTIDDSGFPINEHDHVLKLNEPLINVSNPNTIFTNIDGGQFETTSICWVSRHKEFTKGTKVATDDNEYQVVSKAEVLPNLVYYQLKAVSE